MSWNRGIFQGSLAKEKIIAQLPRVPPDTWPLTVNEHAFIVPAQEDRPTLNPLVEYYYGPTWDIHTDLAMAGYQVMDQPVASMQMNLKALAADERYKKEVAGTQHTVQGETVTLDTSREGRNIFVQTLSIMADTHTVNWKFPECWLTLTKSELADVVMAGAAHIQACFEWEKQISDQIDAAETKAQLLAIEIVSVSEQPQE
jgi:hypothetical protein